MQFVEQWKNGKGAIEEWEVCHTNRNTMVNGRRVQNKGEKWLQSNEGNADCVKEVGRGCYAKYAGEDFGSDWHSLRLASTECF